jgi:alpha-L-rhamnosidase
MTQQEFIQANETGNVTITAVRFEHFRDALGIGESSPRLSWMIATTVSPWYQSDYQIEAYRTDGQLHERTERIASDQSVLVPWPFTPLASRESLTVRVRVWGSGSDGRPSAWSNLFPVEAGLLWPDDWTARFVTPDWNEDTSQPQSAPLLRHQFAVRPGLTRARLYITALGVYEASLNGTVIGDAILTPGWTKYDSRLLYQTFDVTRLLRPGQNALGAMLADGWYRGRLGFNGGRRNIYGDRLALLAQLEINYADGTSERIVTDETWHAARGPILESSLYDGETYDARLELPGWSEPAYDDSGWRGVRVLERDLATLSAPSSPPVRRTDLLPPVAIMTSPSGHTIVDFGQNLVGRLRLSVQGEAGQHITLRHAEILEHGELCVRPLRLAKATDSYTLRGGKRETWEPRFTFHGFRYAQVDGWPGTLRAEDICAVVCHSDLERTGWFECSDPLLNRFHENVVWSMRGNFLSIPTDCPQRDERLGWTGDIQMFAPTACFLYDSAGFLSSWLADLALEQKAAGGIVPFVVPNIVPMAPIAAAGWGDAAVIVPWMLYQRYGDKGILATQFESMRAWVDHVADIAGQGYLWEKGFQFGDWLDPSAPPDHPEQARTNPHVVATAYFAHSAELVGQTAGVLGHSKEEAHYLG